MRKARLVSVRPRAGACTAAELPALIAALDDEFVHARGRSGSLAVRFPELLVDENLDNIHVRRQGGQVVACCVVRQGSWATGHERWRAAMIGLVHTAPAARGKGHAAAILEATVDACAADGSDFVVLWSGLDRFYERLGWDAHDRGVFGSVQLVPAAPRTLPALDSERFESLRARSGVTGIERGPLNYRHVPLPVKTVGTVFARAGKAEGGALVGACGPERYVYEVVGDEDALPALWREITRGTTAVHVNEAIGSPFHRWLVRHVPIEFSGQHLAYWRMLSPRARRSAWRNWHIPYFDRI